MSQTTGSTTIASATGAGVVTPAIALVSVDILIGRLEAIGLELIGLIGIPGGDLEG